MLTSAQLSHKHRRLSEFCGPDSILLQALNILGLILDKASRMSCLTSILFRYFDMFFTKLGKPASYQGRSSFNVITATV